MTHPHEGVEWFAGEMEDTLEANSHKRGWDDIDPVEGMTRMKQEVKELNDEVELYEFGVLDPGDLARTAERVIREATDVANYAMMVAWKVRHERPPKNVTTIPVPTSGEIRVRLSRMKDHLIEVLTYPEIEVVRIRYVDKYDPETDKTWTTIERDEIGIGDMAAIVVRGEPVGDLGKPLITVPFSLEMVYLTPPRDVADMLAPKVTEGMENFLRNVDRSTEGSG